MNVMKRHAGAGSGLYVVRPAKGRHLRPSEMYRRTLPFARAFATAPTTRSTRLALLAGLVALACACPRPAAAQQPARGSIDGVVVDDSTGERRPAVTVTIVGTQRGALTDEQGRFTIGDLAAGSYTLRTRALARHRA
jgi:hypothetical protein